METVTPGTTITLDSALRHAGRTFLRFPIVILASLVGTWAALRHNHLPAGLPEASAAARLAICAWLGVSLLLALALFAEGRRLHRYAGWGLQAGGLLLLAGAWLLFGQASAPERLARFWLLMAASHLLLALAPALGKGATEASFWRFNLSLLARAAQSLLHAGLLLLGVTVALAAVKRLFALPIPDAVFRDPAIAVLGGFHTWYFLSGLPFPRAGEAEVQPAYPRTLRRAAQFILMPLMAVYLIILYVYALRALVTWTWPAGGGSWLILAFCAVGLFTLFLIQPVAEREGPPAAGEGAWAGNWFRFFGRHFYPALLPLLGLLFAAIGRRVHEYGITENRYLVLAFAMWLAGVTLHTLIDRRRDLRVLPASLCLVALSACFGPWGAFEVSRRSQVQRLQGILESHDMLVGGKLAKAPGPVSREAKREIAAIAGWLEDRSRLGDLTPWLPSLDDTMRTHPVVWFGALDNKFSFLQALELPYVPPTKAGGPAASGLAFLCRACEAPLKRVTGFDLLFVDFKSESLLGEGRELPPVEEGLPGLRFAFEPDSGLLRFSARDSAVLDMDLGAYFRRLKDRYPDAYDLNLPEEEMVMEEEADRLKVRLRLRSLRGGLERDSAQLRDFSADVFVQVKPAKGRRAPR